MDRENDEEISDDEEEDKEGEEGDKASSGECMAKISPVYIFKIIDYSLCHVMLTVSALRSILPHPNVSLSLFALFITSSTVL
jgi:predicted Ser/Thr protein kinase